MMRTKFADLLPKPLKMLAIRFDRSALQTVEETSEFVCTRSSYVAQTSMFGYLKTRMGTRFPQFFEDEVFSRSIRIGAAKLFVTCLGDMTIYAVAYVGHRETVSVSHAVDMAGACFDQGLAQILAEQDADLVPDQARDDFLTRCAAIDWSAAPDAYETFAASERDVIRFAPVIDAFKASDREIVGNSIRFRWRDVREQFRRRIDTAAVVEDWMRVNAREAGSER